MSRRSHRSLAVAVLSGAALFAIAAPAGAVEKWLAPFTLSTATRDSEDAAVAFDSAGDATFVWREFDGSHWRIKARFRPAGGVVGAPVFLSASGFDADEPAVAMNAAGRAVAVWQR